MSFESFNEPLPEDYFSSGERVFTRSKGSTEKRRDSLVDLLNDLRANSDFGGYQVDPDDDSKFSSIAEAFVVADENEPDGREIRITIANGTYTDNVDFGNDHPIILESINHKGAKIEGDLTFGEYSSLTSHMIRNCHMNGGTVNINDGTDLRFVECRTDAATFALDPSAGSVGYFLRFINCKTPSGSSITESDIPAASGTVIVFNGGSVAFQSSGAAPISLKGTDLAFRNISEDAGSWLNAGNLFDLNGEATFVYWENVTAKFLNFVGSVALYTNGGSTTAVYRNAEFHGNDDILNVDFGGANADLGAPKFYGKVAPANPPVGSEWVDNSLSDNLIWDGTYWGNGTIFRKDLLVDVDTAAVSHSSGWTVPAGAGVINTSANALKALTAAGGATLYGISDGSDGDKFAESSALIKNSKASAKQASINVGGGDTIYVHSMTASGTEGGTLAGSNDEDVRVVVYFTMPKTLPSV